MYYIIISAATVLFGAGFCCNKLYQKNEGVSLTATLLFALINSGIISLLMLILNGIKIGFSLFSFIVALWYAANSLLYIYCSMKALEHANLSLYSMFAMLGGMLLPFAAGIIFWHEPLTLPKIIGCVLTAAALFLCVQNTEKNKKAVLYYFLVFVFNGCSGIISKVHQSAGNGKNISETSLLFLADICIFAVCAIGLLIFARGKVRLMQPKESIMYGVGYAAGNGCANLLLLIALKHLDASVQYPFVTGGTIIVTAGISAIIKERITKKNIAAVILAFAAAYIVTL